MTMVSSRRCLVSKIFLLAVACACRTEAQTTNPLPVVQVAVNYAPGKSTMISGFLVGGGRYVLTQASVLDGAYDTAVALSNTDVQDPVLERLDERLNVAVLRLPEPVKAELLAAEAIPAGELSASIIGAPEAFQTGRVSVLLTPLAGGRRWKIMPAIPPAFRGAPLLNEAGKLLGIVVEERPGGSVVGIPLTELSALAPVLSAGTAEKTEKTEKTAVAPAPSKEPGTASAVPRAAQPDSAAPTTPPERPASERTRESAAGSPPARAPQPAPATSPLRETEPRPTARVSETRPQPPVPVLADVRRPLSRLGAPRLVAKLEVRRPPEAAPARPSAAKPAPTPTATETTAGAVKSATRAPTSTPVATIPSAEVTRPAGITPTRVAPATASVPPAAPPAGAAEDFEARIRREPQNISLRLDYADELISRGNIPQAVELLEQAREQFPSEPQVYWHLAHAYWQQSLHKPDGSRRSTMEMKSYLKTLASFETFIEMAPNDPQAYQARYRLDLLKRAQFGRLRKRSEYVR